MNVKDIINSWIKTASHTEEESKEAFRRMSICKECPLFKEGIGGIKMCSDCGCPISYNEIPIGKSYSKEQGCPLNKW